MGVVGSIYVAGVVELRVFRLFGYQQSIAIAPQGRLEKTPLNILGIALDARGAMSVPRQAGTQCPVWPLVLHVVLLLGLLIRRHLVIRSVLD